MQSLATAIARQWTPTIAPNTLSAAPLIGIATGALAGIIPALKASHTTRRHPPNMTGSPRSGGDG
ncbi:MAG: hypothetical protein AAB131_01585 [Actinomycetota bacterium]